MSLRSWSRALHWDAAANQYARADGSLVSHTLRPTYLREIWTPAVAGATVKVILERSSTDEVQFELRIDLVAGAALPKARLRLLAADDTELRAIDVAPMQAPPNSTTGMVTGATLRFEAGDVVRAVLSVDGQPAQTSPPLTP